MKEKYLRRVTAVLLALLFCAGMAAQKAFAATSQLCALKLVSSDNGVFIYRLENTSITFRSSVKDGATSSQTVKLTVGDDCKVLSDGKRLTGSASGSNVVYTFSDAGSYTIRIKAPTEGEAAPYANFSFTIWSSPQTAGSTPATAESANSIVNTAINGIIGGAAVVTGGTSLDPLASEPDSYVAGDGHLVVPVDLRETYFSDFHTYEQQFKDRYFYTNVANGKITNEQVYMDVPSGIGVLMHKDGSSMEFQNRTYLSQYGSYQITLNYYEKQSADYPAVEYVATFRFRIQEPLEALHIGENYEQDAGMARPDMEAEPEGEGTSGLPENITEGDMDAYIKDLIGEPGLQNAVLMENTGIYTGLMQAFDAEKKMYSQTAADATVFYSNIPNGAVASSDVSLSFPDGMKVTVLKDDVAYQYTPGDVIGEDGVYYVTVGQNASAAFSFRIIKNPVRDLNICYAPAEFRIGKVELDGESIAAAGEYVNLEQDGNYVLTFSGQGQEMTLDIVRDTQPPAFTLTGVENGIARGGTVTVEYQSDDAASLEVLKNGEKVDYTGNIQDAGNYEVRVFDKAGNTQRQSFELKYRMNAAGVMAILLLLLLAAAGAFVFLRFKRDTKVR